MPAAGDGEQFDRPELQQLLALPSNSDRSVTAIIGDPGSGKSALLAMLGKRLIEAGHPVLAIKSDLLDTDVLTRADIELAFPTFMVTGRTLK